MRWLALNFGDLAAGPARMDFFLSFFFFGIHSTGKVQPMCTGILNKQSENHIAKILRLPAHAF
jgi:hypothetical protein